jgi:hypothetical protein
MNFKYLVMCGTGRTCLELSLKDDKTFTMHYESRWMGQDEIKLDISGIYSNNKNNYYFLEVTKIGDYEEAKYITFELVTLTSTQEIHGKDVHFEFLMCSNGGILNKKGEPKFDAIMFSRLQGYEHYAVSECDVLDKFLKDIMLCKLIKV